MISYILIAVAAIFNLIMDTLTYWKPKSIFKNLDDKWWNPLVSWQYVPNFLGWMRFDAWHIAKMGMVLSFIFAVVLYVPVLGWWDVPLMYLEWGIIWELTKRIIYK